MQFPTTLTATPVPEELFDEMVDSNSCSADLSRKSW
jgi:hypothetical protein